MLQVATLYCRFCGIYCVRGLQVRYPYRAAGLSCEVSEQRFSRERTKQVLRLYVCLVPLENQNPARCKHPPALRKTCHDVGLPCLLVQKPVLLVNHTFHRATCQMRRVKDNHLEHVVRERHVSKVGNLVRLNTPTGVPVVLKCALLNLSAVHKKRVWVSLVPPEHPATAAGI